MQIHISQTTKDHLEHEPYIIEERGKIFVKVLYKFCTLKLPKLCTTPMKQCFFFLLRSVLWCSSNISYYYECWKQLRCLIFF